MTQEIVKPDGVRPSLEALRLKEVFSGSALEDKYEQMVEEEKVQYAQSRKLFDIDSLIFDAERPRELVLEDRGFSVWWCPLNSEEREEVNRVVHSNKEIETDRRNRRAFYLMCRKAQPTNVNITEENVNRLDATIIDAFLLKVTKESDSFLLPLVQNVLDGYNRILKPRKG
jgi:hypothetical protein